jgi:hypothetical protein
MLDLLDCTDLRRDQWFALSPFSRVAGLDGLLGIKHESLCDLVVMVDEKGKVVPDVPPIPRLPTLAAHRALVLFSLLHHKAAEHQSRLYNDAYARYALEQLLMELIGGQKVDSDVRTDLVKTIAAEVDITTFASSIAIYDKDGKGVVSSITVAPP